MPPRIGETAALVALTPAERLVLWGVRTWFVGACTGVPLLPLIADVFRQAMAVPAIPALDTAMTLVAAGAGREGGMALHQPGCPCIGDAERLLLDLLALHQAGEPATALFLARTLLPPAGARLAGPALRALALELAACGVRLPDRRGEPVPAAAPVPAPTHPMPSATLH